jgi:hypothetical protein
MVSPVSITHTFNGDAAAHDYVDAAALDTTLGELAAAQNAEQVERKRIIGDGGDLAAQVVHARHLAPEVVTIMQGLFPLQVARLVTTTNVALTGLQTIDGVVLLAADRVLLVGQTNSLENGLWVAASGAWTRPADFLSQSVPVKGTAVAITSGTNLAGTVWMLNSALIVGITGQQWVQIGNAGLRITISPNAAPAGMADGSIWMQYTP